MLSQFVREELPEVLLQHDSPRKAPPRMNAGYGSYQRSDRRYGSTPREINRPVDIFSHPKRKAGAEEFGVEKIAPGSRVEHAMFGQGVVVSTRDMGGDVLYEVAFDSGVTKKLMATFAKLKKI